jgi:DNA-binding CsgD family transcriptional regulator
MNNTIPAFIEGNDLEIYAFEDKLKAIYKGDHMEFGELPSDIKEKFLDHMLKNTKALKGFASAGYESQELMLKQYVFCCFGGFNTESDMTADNVFNPEFWDCGLRNVCPFNCQICGGIAAENGKFIAKKETEILKLIGKGLQNKEISHLRGISINTVTNVIVKLFEKTKCQNRTELAMWAVKKNLV